MSHETIRFWWNRFGPIFAAGIRKKRKGRMRALLGCRWHLDEVFVKINGERHYLWRAVDQEGEVLEAFVSKKRDRKAALKFLRKLTKRYPRPDAIITDRLRSYRAALRELGGSGRHQAGRWRNNRAENSHLPFRRREHAMLRFRRMRSLQKFATVHSVRLQPLQPATIPLLTGQFQAQPRRCTCPVASTRGGLIPCPRWNNSDLRFYSDSARITLRVVDLKIVEAIPDRSWHLDLQSFLAGGMRGAGMAHSASGRSKVWGGCRWIRS